MDMYTVIALLSVLSLAYGQDYSASCKIMEDSGEPSEKIKGDITFTQPRNGGQVTVTVNLDGFAAPDGQHGFHVHAVADLGNKCKNAKGHYNPRNVTHGGPNDPITARHVGDLGNVEEKNQKVMTTITDSIISLRAEDKDRNIIGRAIVVHAKADDLGRGGAPDSKTTGAAGARLGCCIIKDTTQTNSALPIAVSFSMIIVSILVTLFNL